MFVLPSTRFELTPLIYCSTNRLNHKATSAIYILVAVRIRITPFVFIDVRTFIFYVQIRKITKNQFMFT